MPSVNAIAPYVRKQWPLLLLLTMLLAFPWLYSTFLVRPKVLDTQGMNLPGDATATTYPVKLLAQPYITRTSGHAHSPFGVHGKNMYEYDGDVEIDGKEYELECESHEPIAAIRLGSELYLITRGYFRQNCESFVIFRADASETFRGINVASLPKALWRLEFTDRDLTCTFRVWLLEAIAKEQSEETAIDCFIELVEIDPRLGLLDDWRSSDPFIKSGNDIQTFAADVLWTCKNKNAVPAFMKMTRSFKKNDSPTTMTFLLGSLLRLDPEKAIPTICEFKRSIPDLTDENDMRALVFLHDEILSKVNCESP